MSIFGQLEIISVLPRALPLYHYCKTWLKQELNSSVTSCNKSSLGGDFFRLYYNGKSWCWANWNGYDLVKRSPNFVPLTPAGHIWSTSSNRIPNLPFLTLAGHIWSTWSNRIPILFLQTPAGQVWLTWSNRIPILSPLTPSWSHMVNLVKQDPNFVPNGRSWSHLVDWSSRIPILSLLTPAGHF
jgi:hypothetical protein